MNSCIPSSLNDSWESFKNGFYAEVEKMPQRFEQAEIAIGVAFQVISKGVCEAGAAIGSALSSTADKTARFVSNNWEMLIKYSLAWGVIITCTGILYGFEAVSLPLTIGLACGSLFGIVAGIISVNSYDPKGKYTLWNLLNNVIKGLNKTTRQIVLSVAVTVLLAASVVFPYVIGAVFGLINALQVTVKIFTEQDLGRDPKKIATAFEQLKVDHANLQNECSSFKDRLNALELVMQDVVKG